MRRAFRTRLRILAGILVLIAAFLILRLYFVQIIHGSDYALRAQRQYISSSQELYDRGNIYFTRKDGTLISAATLATGYLIAIDSEELQKPSTVYPQLNAITPINSAKFYADAEKDDPYEVIADNVPEAQGDAISQLNIPGVLVERE